MNRKSLETYTDLINRLNLALKNEVKVESAWLEGSLAKGTSHSRPDINLFFTIQDDSFERLWNQDRSWLLNCIPIRAIVINEKFVSLLSDNGITVDIEALPLSELPKYKTH